MTAKWSQLSLLMCRNGPMQYRWCMLGDSQASQVTQDKILSRTQCMPLYNELQCHEIVISFNIHNSILMQMIQSTL